METKESPSEETKRTTLLARRISHAMKMMLIACVCRVNNLNAIDAERLIIREGNLGGQIICALVLTLEESSLHRRGRVWFIRAIIKRQRFVVTFAARLTHGSIIKSPNETRIGEIDSVGFEGTSICMCTHIDGYTCRRSSPAPNSCPLTVRPQQRSAAGPTSYALPATWRRPAADSRWESAAPCPGCPTSWRRLVMRFSHRTITRLSQSPLRPTNLHSRSTMEHEPRHPPAPRRLPCAGVCYASVRTRDVNMAVRLPERAAVRMTHPIVTRIQRRAYQTHSTIFTILSPR